MDVAAESATTPINEKEIRRGKHVYIVLAFATTQTLVAGLAGYYQGTTWGVVVAATVAGFQWGILVAMILMRLALDSGSRR